MDFARLPLKRVGVKLTKFTKKQADYLGFHVLHGTNVSYGITRLHADGTLDNSFNPGPGSLAYSPIALQPDGKVIIAGELPAVNGAERSRILRLNSDGSPDLGSNPGVEANGIIRCLDIQSDGNILIGGNFTTVNGVVRPYVARLYGDAAAPSLSITWSSSLMIISWPSPSPGFTLQANTDLNATNWTAPLETITDNGTTKSISVSPAAGNRFFRLFKP